MDPAEVDLRPAAEADGLGVVEALLTDCGLPTEDVRANADALYLGYDGDDRVGVVGLEVHGDAGLLRSLAVERSRRSEGYGSALCDAVERRARAAGVERLYLLTTTAVPFFADQGFREVDRTDAPPAIRATDQFDRLCPDSAVCMEKPLGE